MRRFTKISINTKITKMTSSCQDLDASLNFSSPATLNFSNPIVKDRELEMLIIASIQNLKRAKQEMQIR